MELTGPLGVISGAESVFQKLVNSFVAERTLSGLLLIIVTPK
jgi:hypothetical protein